MTDAENEALHKIQTHEEVCTERYSHIHKSLDKLSSQVGELAAEQKAMRANLEAQQRRDTADIRKEMKASDDTIKSAVQHNTDAINKINLKLAWQGGVAFAGALLGGWLFQLFSGIFAK